MGLGSASTPTGRVGQPLPPLEPLFPPSVPLRAGGGGCVYQGPSQALTAPTLTPATFRIAPPLSQPWRGGGWRPRRERDPGPLYTQGATHGGAHSVPGGGCWDPAGSLELALLSEGNSAGQRQSCHHHHRHHREHPRRQDGAVVRSTVGFSSHLWAMGLWIKPGS